MFAARAWRPAAAVARVSFVEHLEPFTRDANLGPDDPIEPAPEKQLTKPHRTAIRQDPMTVSADPKAVRNQGESIRRDRIDVEEDLPFVSGSLLTVSDADQVITGHRMTITESRVVIEDHLMTSPGSFQHSASSPQTIRSRDQRMNGCAEDPTRSLATVASPIMSITCFATSIASSRTGSSRPFTGFFSAAMNPTRPRTSFTSPIASFTSPIANRARVAMSI